MLRSILAFAAAANAASIDIDVMDKFVKWSKGFCGEYIPPCRDKDSKGIDCIPGIPDDQRKAFDIRIANAGYDNVVDHPEYVTSEFDSKTLELQGKAFEEDPTGSDAIYLQNKVVKGIRPKQQYFRDLLKRTRADYDADAPDCKMGAKKWKMKGATQWSCLSEVSGPVAGSDRYYDIKRNPVTEIPYVEHLWRDNNEPHEIDVSYNRDVGTWTTWYWNFTERYITQRNWGHTVEVSNDQNTEGGLGMNTPFAGWQFTQDSNPEQYRGALDDSHENLKGAHKLAADEALNVQMTIPKVNLEGQYSFDTLLKGFGLIVCHSKNNAKVFNIEKQAQFVPPVVFMNAEFDKEEDWICKQTKEQKDAMLGECTVTNRANFKATEADHTKKKDICKRICRLDHKTGCQVPQGEEKCRYWFEETVNLPKPSGKDVHDIENNFIMFSETFCRENKGGKGAVYIDIGEGECKNCYDQQGNLRWHFDHNDEKSNQRVSDFMNTPWKAGTKDSLWDVFMARVDDHRTDANKPNPFKSVVGDTNDCAYHCIGPKDHLYGKDCTQGVGQDCVDVDISAEKARAGRLNLEYHHWCHWPKYPCMSRSSGVHPVDNQNPEKGYTKNSVLTKGVYKYDGAECPNNGASSVQCNFEDVMNTVSTGSWHFPTKYDFRVDYKIDVAFPEEMFTTITPREYSVISGQLGLDNTRPQSGDNWVFQESKIVPHDISISTDKDDQNLAMSTNDYNRQQPPRVGGILDKGLRYDPDLGDIQGPVLYNLPGTAENNENDSPLYSGLNKVLLIDATMEKLEWEFSLNRKLYLEGWGNFVCDFPMFTKYDDNRYTDKGGDRTTAADQEGGYNQRMVHASIFAPPDCTDLKDGHSMCNIGGKFIGQEAKPRSDRITLQVCAIDRGYQGPLNRNLDWIKRDSCRIVGVCPQGKNCCRAEYDNWEKGDRVVCKDKNGVDLLNDDVKNNAVRFSVRSDVVDCGLYTERNHNTGQMDKLSRECIRNNDANCVEEGWLSKVTEGTKGMHYIDADKACKDAGFKDGFDKKSFGSNSRCMNNERPQDTDTFLNEKKCYRSQPVKCAAPKDNFGDMFTGREGTTKRRGKAQQICARKDEDKTKAEQEWCDSLNKEGYFEGNNDYNRDCEDRGTAFGCSRLKDNVIGPFVTWKCLGTRVLPKTCKTSVMKTQKEYGDFINILCPNTGSKKDKKTCKQNCQGKFQKGKCNFKKKPKCGKFKSDAQLDLCACVNGCVLKDGKCSGKSSLSK